MIGAASTTGDACWLLIEPGQELNGGFQSGSIDSYAVLQLYAEPDPRWIDTGKDLYVFYNWHNDRAGIESMNNTVALQDATRFRRWHMHAQFELYQELVEDVSSTPENMRYILWGHTSDLQTIRTWLAAAARASEAFDELTGIDQGIARNEAMSGLTLQVVRQASVVIPRTEYYEGVVSLLDQEMGLLVEQIKDMAVQTLHDYDLPIQHVKVRQSRSVEDPEWQEIVIEIGVAASAQDALSIWDIVGDKIAELKTSLSPEQAALVDSSISFQLQWL